MSESFDINICTYCLESIQGLRIQCCECEEFIICLTCFSNGAEIGPHKNDHSYKFLNDWQNMIFFKDSKPWTVQEELRLLKNMEILGYGNWRNISNLMNKSAKELKDHYSNHYLDGVIGKATWGKVQRPDIKEDLNLSSPLTIGQKAFNRLPPLDIRFDEAQHLGYIPKRGDFEREYSTDIEAEKIISALDNISLDDYELEKAIKLSQVDLYLRRLRDRAKMKRIVRDYQIVGKYYYWRRKDTSKNLTKDQRDLRERFCVFAQFSSSVEHECLINGLEKEQELKSRLDELARYRENGLLHLDECAHFDAHLACEKRTNTPNVAASSLTPMHWRIKSKWIKSILPEPSTPVTDSVKKKAKRRKKLKFAITKNHLPHRQHLFKRGPRKRHATEGTTDQSTPSSEMSSLHCTQSEY